MENWQYSLKAKRFRKSKQKIRRFLSSGEDHFKTHFWTDDNFFYGVKISDIEFRCFKDGKIIFNNHVFTFRIRKLGTAYKITINRKKVISEKFR